MKEHEWDMILSDTFMTIEQIAINTAFIIINE